MQQASDNTAEQLRLQHVIPMSQAGTQLRQFHGLYQLSVNHRKELTGINAAWVSSFLTAHQHAK